MSTKRPKPVVAARHVKRALLPSASDARLALIRLRDEIAHAPTLETADRIADAAAGYQRMFKPITDVIHVPRPGRHSQKPVVFYEIIERMYPDLPRIELFARAVRPGWPSWGMKWPEN
jgi:hypothetical protein